ncbi:prolyl oligopeptidase family serine peptidase [Streptomonospora sp. S1-112]|uniref:Prolyl oligopeptidase family serine peptidase n=1 Tax=Streptomonospora mangrovi TaxID=2883123 RepID=A0A9X3NKB1_9ACTN|nr:prolyl oligopeptidase family serine peptidase [Streptomonospora mangrovi]MDA0563641.1 prolyl oligopeptidase family serine peptidase [Streptomonospora mangrovi]
MDDAATALGAPREQGDTAELRTAERRPDRSIYCYREEPPDDEPGKWAVYSWDRTTGERRRLTDLEHNAADAVISADGETVYWFKPTHPGSEDGTWVSQPFASAPGDEAPVAPGLPPGRYLGGSARAGKFAFCMEFDGELPPGGKRFGVYVAEREGTESTEGTVREIAADDTALLNGPMLSADGTLVAFVNGVIGGAWADVRRTADGSPVRRVGDREGVSVVPIQFSTDPASHELLLFREGPDDDLRSLVVADADDPADERRLSREGVVGELYQRWTSWWLTEARYAPDGWTALAVFNDGFDQRVYRFDTTRPDAPPTLVPTEPGTLKDVAARPDGSVEYRWQNMFSAGEYRSTSGAVFPFAPSKPPLLGPGEARVQRMWVDVAVPENGRLSVVVVTPTAPPPPGGYPLLLDVHGGPVSSIPNAPPSEVSQTAVKAGAVLVMPDYAGSGGYGRAWRTSIYGRAGTTEVDHLQAAVEAVVARGRANPERAVNPDHMTGYGFSYGGFLVALLMTRGFPNGVCGGPLLAPEINHADPKAALSMRITHETHFGGPPDASPEAWERASARLNSDGITGRMHVLRYTLDTRYGFRQAKAFEDAVRERGKDNISFTDFADGHNPDRRPKEVAEAVREVETGYVLKFLGLSRPPATEGAGAGPTAARAPGLRDLRKGAARHGGRGLRNAVRRDPDRGRGKGRGKGR